MAQHWSSEERRLKANLVHQVYEGVHTEDSDMVSDALCKLESWGSERALGRGLLIGMFVGGTLGAIGFYLGLKF